MTPSGCRRITTRLQNVPWRVVPRSCIRRLSLDRKSFLSFLQVYDRNKENATDTSTSISAVKEFIQAQKEVDVVCLIQVYFTYSSDL